MVLFYSLGVTKIHLKALLFFNRGCGLLYQTITEKSHIISIFIKEESQILVGHSVLEKPTLKTQIFYFLGLLAIISLEDTRKPCIFGTDTPSPGTAGVCYTSGLCC